MRQRAGRIVALCVLLPAAGGVLVRSAGADAPVPAGGTTIATVARNADGSQTVVLRGSWSWPSRAGDCNVAARAAGFAVDWNDPGQPGNAVGALEVGAAAANAYNPADDLVHATPPATDSLDPASWRGGCGSVDPALGYAKGTWGPIAHTYGPDVTGAVEVCPVTYDVHLSANGGAPSRQSEITAGGGGHNGDNSVEKPGGPTAGSCVHLTLAPPPAWKPGPDLPQSWSEGFGAIQQDEAATIGGRVYLLGHDPYGRVFSFDPAADGTWTLQSATEPYVDIDSGSAAFGGKLWIAGQAQQPWWEGGGPLGFNVTEVYDPATDTFTLGPPLPGPARYQPQLVASGGVLYAFGGRDGAPGNSDVYAGAYRLALDGSAWEPIASVPTPVADPAAAAGPDGRIYLFGGVAGCPSMADPPAWSCPGGAATSLVQVYDPASDSWSTAAPMPTARYTAAAVRAGGGIYVLGGRVGLTPPVFPPQYPPSLATVELYDPVADAWRTAPSLQTGRAQEAVTRVNGEVWVFGGSPPETASWSSEHLAPEVPVSLTVSPASPDGDNGWYRTAPTLTVDSTRALLGAATLVYGFDGATSSHPYTGAAQTVTAADGSHLFTAQARDGAGISSTVATAQLQVDATAPTVALRTGPRGSYVVEASDAGSGLARVELDAQVSALAGTLVTPQQAMEGDLKVAPGTTLRIGYAVSVPDRHAAATIAVGNAFVTFQASCGPASAGTFVAPLPDASFSVGANDGGWQPSGDQRNPATWQATVTVPDLCQGAKVRLNKGGFLTGTLTTTGTAKVNLKWHYSDGHSSGSWSTTQPLVPATPVGTPQTVVLASAQSSPLTVSGALPVGTTQLVASASDAAGNSATVSRPVP